MEQQKYPNEDAQLDTQDLQGVIDLAFDGFFGDAKLFGDFFVGQVGFTAEFEDFAHFGWQGGDLFFDECGKLVFAEQVVGGVFGLVHKGLKGADIAGLDVLPGDEIEDAVADGGV